MLRSCGVVLALASARLCWGAPTPDNCRELLTYGKRTEAATCYEALSKSADPAVRAEGFWGLQEYEQANEAFRLAVAQPGSTGMVRVRWGLLFHERFNNQEADNLFAEALKLEPAERQRVPWEWRS